MANHENSQSKCCGVVQEGAALARERRERRRSKAQPWIVLKSAIVFTLAIMAYASYVYIGRFCVPTIRSNDGPLGGRRIGIPFLVIFCILLLMMLWTYAMVVLISPGLARDYVEKTPAPVYENAAAVPRWWDSTSDIGAGAYEYMPETRDGTRTSHAHEASTLHSEPSSRVAEKPGGHDNAGVTDAIPPVAAAHVRTQSNAVAPHQSDSGRPNQLPMMYTRRPPKTPILRPEYRYCHKDGFVKPMRAHHCRACGTCILKYDHHCPWIGQCVGAQNHKFFIHFLQWASLFCMWTFATLVAGIVQEGQNGDVDPQFIIIIVLSALFIFFTLALLLTHIRLILLNQSTVESLNVQDMKEREKIVLARMFSWYQCSEKRRTRGQWNQEWGRIDIEGNIWWLGSHRKNWESVMGPSKWGWFFPVGRTPTDGIHWTVNPRFDAEGKWRPRREWPRALQ